ncbi:hypothetical protein CEE44_01365 [Candidatus Woesearchaeota archaeon B3_Woes]|nr:MAG: hypothetical protein CEE44_01365 [Candidatus Woesearchaeota archaeon B3_Woes]
MIKNWKKEIARDLLALGGIPFYFIVLIRAIIGKYSPFVYQLVITLVVLVILSLIFKNSNQHIARGLILVFFTSLFYKDILFTIFASLLWLFMIFSLFYLKVKSKEIVKGVLFGVISMTMGYYLTPFLIVG